MADTFLTGIFGERLSYSTDVLNCIANLSNDEVFNSNYLYSNESR